MPNLVNVLGIENMSQALRTEELVKIILERYPDCHDVFQRPAFNQQGFDQTRRGTPQPSAHSFSVISKFAFRNLEDIVIVILRLKSEIERKTFADFVF